MKSSIKKWSISLLERETVSRYCLCANNPQLHWKRRMFEYAVEWYTTRAYIRDNSAPLAHQDKTRSRTTGVNKSA